jgi:hypothetical protein
VVLLPTPSDRPSLIRAALFQEWQRKNATGIIKAMCDAWQATGTHHQHEGIEGRNDATNC